MIFHLKIKWRVTIQFHIFFSSVEFYRDFFHRWDNFYIDKFVYILRGFCSQMMWFEDVAYLAWNNRSSCSKIAHQQPSIVIFCLSVKRDYLSSNFEGMDGAIVAACNFSSKRIYSQPTSVSIMNQFVIWCLCSFLICQTCAFISARLLVTDACWWFEHSCYLCHLC